MGRGVTIALLVSLAFNILAVGFIGGRFIGHHGAFPPSHERTHFARPGAFWGGGKGLPPENRDAFVAVFRQHREELHAVNDEVRKARQAFTDAVGAPDWDRAAVENALSVVKAAEAKREALMSSLFIDAMETLPPEQRRMLTERGERYRHGRHKRFRRHGMDRPWDDSDTPPPPPPDAKE